MDNTIIGENSGKPKRAGRIGHKAVLLILSDNFFGKSYIIDHPVVTIGRDETNDFVIDDHLVSRSHCRISYDVENHFYIEDLDSTNSLYINSKRLKKQKLLCYGDRIIIGNTILRFFREETAEKKKQHFS